MDKCARRFHTGNVEAANRNFVSQTCKSVDRIIAGWFLECDAPRYSCSNTLRLSLDLPRSFAGAIIGLALLNWCLDTRWMGTRAACLFTPDGLNPRYPRRVSIGRRW